jgi:ribonuclease P/MRP protein subunit POP1
MGFPEDWPGTKAGDLDNESRSVVLKEKWNRQPPAKRPNWSKVMTTGEIGDPFKCDWSLLFTDNTQVEDPIQRIKKQAEAAMEGMESQETVVESFLLSPGYTKQLLLKVSPMVTTIDLRHALIPIRLRFLQKGNISFRARIYRLPLDAEQCQKWMSLLDKMLEKSSKKENPQCPGEGDLIGFITSGNVSLSEGRGRAVGALSWTKVSEEEERWRVKKEFRGCCIVRDVGMDVARLARWEVND